MSNRFYSLREQTTASELARHQSTSRTPGTNGPRRNPVVTPRPRSTNPYGPLETDDDKSNRSINNISSASEISAALSEDLDYQDDFIETTMSTTNPQGTVYEGLSAADQRSIVEPNLNDVQRIRSSIASLVRKAIRRRTNRTLQYRGNIERTPTTGG